MHSENINQMHSENPSLKKRHLHLPEEIIEEILSRLPVKSLVRFRCVSKSWLSLVESDRFIKIHYQNSSKSTSSAYHIVAFNGYAGFSWHSLQSFLNSNSKKGSSTSISIADPTDRGGINLIVGCCNGVLCLLSSLPRNIFWLWNPATKVVVELPELLGDISCKYGFRWDESSGAFKVFATMIDDYGETLGHVYSSKTNSWKTVPSGVDDNDCSMFNFCGVFVCGRTHWAMRLCNNEQYVIESFNMGSDDEFEMIELPPFSANATEGGMLDTRLGEIGGCLCILFHDYEKGSIEVWVMKEYGVKDSWFKRLTFSIDVCDLSIIIHGFPPLFRECDLGGEIFITCTHALMVYSYKDDDFSKVANFYCPYGAFVYVESLVSPL